MNIQPVSQNYSTPKKQLSFGAIPAPNFNKGLIGIIKACYDVDAEGAEKLLASDAGQKFLTSFNEIKLFDLIKKDGKPSRPIDPMVDLVSDQGDTFEVVLSLPGVEGAERRIQTSKEALKYKWPPHNITPLENLITSICDNGRWFKEELNYKGIRP